MNLRIFICSFLLMLVFGSASVFAASTNADNSNFYYSSGWSTSTNFRFATVNNASVTFRVRPTVSTLSVFYYKDLNGSIPNVYINNNLFGSFSTNGTAGTTGSYNITGLELGKLYTISLRNVVNGSNSNTFRFSGLSSYSGTLYSGAPDTVKPPVPGGLVANLNDLSVVLNWNAVANLDDDLVGYYIYQNGVKISSIVTATDYEVTGLSYGTNYSFSVSSVDYSSNESEKSAAVTVTPFNAPPAVPTGLTTIPGNGQLQLSWTPNTESDILRYHIFMDGTYLNTVSHPTTTFTVTGLTPGTNYNFQLVSEDLLGNVSVKSAAVIGAANPAPLVPQALTATAGNQIATLDWTDSPGALSYKIYQNGSLFATTTTKPYTVTSLSNGTTYSYQVSAANTAGDSAKTAAVTATPTLTSPTGLAATPGNTIVTLNWNDVGGASSYKIYQNGSLLTATTTKPYLITGLTNGTNYSYEMTAVGGGGESAKTAAVTAMPDNPAIPAAFTATAGNKYITLDWNTVHNATSYNIFYNGSLLTATTTKPYVITGLTNGTSYSYEVTAVNAMGESDRSPIATATPIATPMPTGLHTNTSSNKVIVSWNPISPPAIKYIVYRDGIKVSELTGTSYTDAAVTNGTMYKYEVSAVDSVQESSKAFVFAKPGDTTDFSQITLPFGVADFFGTTLNFLGKYASWILVVVAVIFVPILLAIVNSLLGNTEKPKRKRWKGVNVTGGMVYAGMGKQKWNHFRDKTLLEIEQKIVREKDQTVKKERERWLKSMKDSFRDQEEKWGIRKPRAPRAPKETAPREAAARPTRQAKQYNSKMQDHISQRRQEAALRPSSTRRFRP